MSNMRTYSSTELIVVYGVSHLTGWADGEFISIAYDDDIFKYTNGADGEVARVKSNKLMATVTCRFLQTSPANDILSGYFLADVEANAPQNLIIKDLNGTTILDGPQSSIMKLADSGFGTENINREWAIKVPKLVGFLGGNFFN